MIGPTCDTCRAIHSAADVQAVDRFGLRGESESGFRAADGTIHATREAAQERLCLQRNRDGGPS